MLVTGGRLAIWDITAGTPGRLDYPLPWANQPELSHLVVRRPIARRLLEPPASLSSTGTTSPTGGMLMEELPASSAAGPRWSHNFIDNFRRKASNLTLVAPGGAERIQGVALANRRGTVRRRRTRSPLWRSDRYHTQPAMEGNPRT